MAALPLQPHLNALADRIRSAHPLLFFTDFDGTLVPIKQNAAECFLRPDIAHLLDALQHCPHTRVGVVSGRSLADLRPRLTATNFVLAGNHGLEIDARDEQFHEPTAVERQPELEAIVHTLDAVLSTIPGVWVEHKGLSATVHYRGVPDDVIPFVRETVQRLTQVARQSGLFVVRDGKSVQEIRPAVNWHKGFAIRWLMTRWTTPDDHPHVIFIGDDTTDEDAFGLLPDDTTIRVGGNPTLARYHVDGVAEVHHFLRWLLQQRAAPSNAR
jgi:trehalose 6-phosphate phosphatase